MADLELNCKWHFAPQMGGREDGPNDAMSDNFKKTPYASLIRESIQNSLDVPLDEEKPVRVEFSISRIHARDYPNFFGIKNHIKGCMKHFNNNDDAKNTYQPMVEYLESLRDFGDLSYVKVSDYNTKGMDYEKGNTSKPFYAFVRSAGVSSKKDSAAGGSFGFGKAAYFYMSPLRTIFVSTKTYEGNSYFEGVSSLCTHELERDDSLYVSVGYYDNNNGEPISNSDLIPTRFKRDEVGTDIYLLGIDVSDKSAIYKQMIEAVLRNFWMAIFSGKLEVKVDENEINRDNLEMVMLEYFPEELDTVPREKKYNPRPYLDAIINSGKNNRYIVIEDDLPVLGHAKFYAIKNKKAQDKVLYMRKPLMLVRALRTQSSNGFYGVFICDDLTGNELLRKTENPAHNEWKSSNWQENGKISPQGRKAIDDVEKFIIDAMKRMFSGENSNIQSIQGLEEFLYIPTAVEDEDDFESESLVGDISDDKSQDGNYLSTEKTKSDTNTTDSSQAIGKIMVENSLSSYEKDDKGNVLSGHGIRKKKNKGNGGLTPRKIDSYYSEVDDGVDGNFLSEVPVHYRSFAQVENDKIIHILVIHSDYEFDNGRIDLKVGGDQSEDVVTIKCCSLPGTIIDNTISGIHIDKGKNVIKIQFVDNMKHSIKLDAYELK